MNRTALAVKTDKGEILGIVLNDPENQDTVNRSITNLIRQHCKSDDVRYSPDQSKYRVITKKGMFTILVEDVSIIN